MLNSSFSFNNTRGFNLSRRDYTDPTNREFTDGRESGGLNGARWLAKVAGMRAAVGMSASAFYNVREGLVHRPSSRRTDRRRRHCQRAHRSAGHAASARAKQLDLA
jgi:hypothetical protein